MFYKKTNIPEESDLVICTVKKVLPHSVFVVLDEYENLEGMIHMSEVSPGRIRNIRDFVVEGKILVCKVLRVNLEKRHIDLSLRRVTLIQKKAKTEEYKQEEKSEKILELVAKNLNLEPKKILDSLGRQLIETFSLLTKAFYSIIRNETDLSELKIPEAYKAELIKVVREKIRLPEVTITGTMVIQCKNSDGINVIKNALLDIDKYSKKQNYNVILRYLGAPNYRIEVTSANFKEAEKVLKELIDMISLNLKKSNSSFEFKR